MQGAPVKAGRQVERVEIDGVLRGQLDEDHKDPAHLEAVGAGQWFVAEDDVKSIMEGDAEVLPVRPSSSSCRRWFDEQVEHEVVELGESRRREHVRWCAA